MSSLTAVGTGQQGSGVPPSYEQWGVASGHHQNEEEEDLEGEMDHDGGEEHLPLSSQSLQRLENSRAVSAENGVAHLIGKNRRPRQYSIGSTGSW